MGSCGHYERGTAHAARLLPSLHAKVVKIKFTWNNVDLYLLCDSHSQGAAGTTSRWTINHARLLITVTSTKPIMVSSSAEKEAQDHADTEPERVLYDDGLTGRPVLRIIHFNDVYHPQ